MAVTTTPTTRTRPKKRPGVAARRFGYVVAALVNLALLYGVNVWPGWDVLPFLTADTTRVLTLVNASLVAGVAANAVYVVRDPRWLRSFGEAFTTAIGVAAMVALWRVFPFDFGDAGFDWSIVVRVLLAIGIVGGAIGIIANLVSLVSDSRSRS